MKRSAIAAGALLALGIALFLLHRVHVSTVQPASAHSDAPVARAAPNSELVNAQLTHADETPSTAPSTPSVQAPASGPESTGILVRGMLRDEQGSPAENAFLRWVGSAGEAHTAIGTHGAYSMAGLRPGHYTVELRGEDYRREDVDVEVAAEPEIQSRDFVMHPGMRFPIRIVDAQGSTLLGAERTEATRRAWNLTVRATRSQPASTVEPLSALSNQNSECGMFLPHFLLEPGHERLGADVLGLLTLHEPPPLCISLAFGSAVVATQRIEEVPKELAFEVEAEVLRSLLAGLRVRLVEADGKSPVSDARVTLFSQSGGPWAMSDQDGRVEFRDQRPGAYELWYAQQSFNVELLPGQVLELGDLRLSKGSGLHVRFEFPTSFEPAVAFVLQPADPGNRLGSLWRPHGALRSTRFGKRVELPDPGPGEFDLIIVSVGDSTGTKPAQLGAWPQRIVLGDTPPEEIVVKLEVTTSVALIPPQDPPSGLRWLISTADGRPALLLRLEGRQPKLVELPRGSYAIMPVSDEPGFLELIEPQKFTVGSSTVAVELSL